MRMLFGLLLGGALLLPSPARAQAFGPRVYVQVPPPPTYIPPPPPTIVIPGPPAYAPFGAVPPHVYIRERIRWHLRRHFPSVVVVAPPPQVIVEAPPAYPPAQVYVAPPPIVAPRIYVPVYYAPQPPLVLVRPVVKPASQWSSKIGLGVRGSGQVINNGWDNLGIGGELLYRASPHLVTELAAEYQRSPDGPLDRTDIPITLGLRIHIGRPDWVVSPYFVVAAGMDISLLDLKFTNDTAYYFDGQVGGGLELRLGQHFAISADARFDGKKRLNDADRAVASTTSINGKPFQPLADEYSGQFRLGVAAYF